MRCSAAQQLSEHRASQGFRCCPPGPGLHPLPTSARGPSVPPPGASGKLLSPTPYGFILPHKHLNWRVPCRAQAPRRVPVPRGVKETG